MFAYSIKKDKKHLDIFVEIGVRVTCTSIKGSKKRLVKCNNDAAATRNRNVMFISLSNHNQSRSKRLSVFKYLCSVVLCFCL